MVLLDDVYSKTELDDYLIVNENYKIPAEPKADSFGWYKGRLVVIDYGN